ncbi:MAG: phosphotransferase [Chloroflexi bacterium]|nr:phosphotransferase [Chloroflexota bacterium]MCY3589485.1 phosphotransferase [Chloroflexota bacterium]MCY3685045.1 phosphotransferase [Chloroflexota bacterium]MDE2707699.1 phosphotransferase [Chloroflexota bacterium]
MPEPTNLSESDLRAIAERSLPHWGLKPDQIELVSQSENSVFRLDMSDGQRYALRIHRPGYHTLPELESELLWTQALNEAGIRVPVGVRTLEGPGYATIPTPDGESSRAVGLVNWLEGELLSSVIDSEADESRIVEHFGQIGRVLAAMNNQASSWMPPAGFTRHAFDVPGYVGKSPFWGRFWDIPPLTNGQRDVLSRARAGIRETLSDYGKNRDTYSMIHADLHAFNILIDPSGVLQAFDFDDSGFGWHQYDLAVVLFGLDDLPYFEAITDALVSGYRTVRPFSDEALSLLPLFLLIRRLVLISWQWERPELGRRDGLEAYIEDACNRTNAFSF